MNGTTMVETDAVAPEVQERIAQDLEPYKEEVAKLEERAKALTVTDDLSEEVATLFINECKRSYTNMEAKRDEKVRPLNTEVKAINDAFRPYTTVLDRLWRATDQIKGAYVTKKQQAIDAANRKAIADAAEARRLEEAKAEAARQEADRLRKEAERIAKEEVEREYQAEMARLAAEQKVKDDQQAVLDAKRKGDEAAAEAAQKVVDDAKRFEETRARKAEEERLAAVAEQDRLAKAAIKQDAKVDIAESKATMVAPTIQTNDSVGTRTLTDGSKVGTREVDEWYFTNGLPIHTDPQKKKYADYYADDPRLPNGIPDRYWLLDLAKLGKDVKNGVPIEGTMRTKRTATTAGRK
jgi:hypothetical protein